MARVLLFVAVVVCSLLLLNGAHAAQEKNWVVIVAGSNGWYNYRHQADACHAYQIVHSHGIPDEQIVVMMYDDLAYDSNNPTPGILINKPNGPDVYNGVLKDYVGNDVTPENFLAVLRGDAEAVRGKGNGKVIHSGPDDHVFVYFTDHGAPGLLAFPNSELYVQDLDKTITQMYQQNQYKKMVIYIEACESGSMMVNLPPNVNVFSTTASNAYESSYACYYDYDRGTYLGDLYSVNWMEDSDQKDLSSETLQQQFTIVKEKTSGSSHVMQFGDLSIGEMKVIEFQGNNKVPAAAAASTVSTKPFEDAIPSPDVPLAILQRQLQKEENENLANTIRQKLHELVEIRQSMQQVVKKIAEMATYSEEQKTRILNGQSLLSQHACYEAAVVAFKNHCFNWNLPKDAASHVEGLPRTKLIRHVVPTPLLTTNCSTIILIRVNTFINQLFLDYHFYIVMNLCQKECYPFSCSIFCCFLRLIK
uniref:legumain n=1 Tax=Eptatretus burgeri TaxID=7764 RepID=A0A8C4NIC2_EPTBU